MGCLCLQGRWPLIPPGEYPLTRWTLTPSPCLIRCNMIKLISSLRRISSWNNFDNSHCHLISEHVFEWNLWVLTEWSWNDILFNNMNRVCWHLTRGGANQGVASSYFLQIAFQKYIAHKFNSVSLVFVLSPVLLEYMSLYVYPPVLPRWRWDNCITGFLFINTD